MRYVTLVARPDGDRINRLDAEIVDLGLEYRAIHRMKLLSDDTVAMFAEGRGDIAGLREVLASAPEVDAFSLSGDESGFFAYTRYEADAVTRRLLEGRRNSTFLIDMPVEHTGDGGLRVTYIGTDAGLSNVLAEQPDDVEIEIERTGTYTPGPRHVVSQLTAHQREILTAAIELGYYQEPRNTTHAAIGETIGLAESTVGEHLRKIEATVVGALHDSTGRV